MTLQSELKQTLTENSQSQSEIQKRMIGGVEEILAEAQHEMEAFLVSRKFLGQKESKPRDLFDYAQIRKLARRYALRFLPVSYYNGTLASDICTKIKEFEETHSSLAPFEYMILAPRRSFTLQKRPVDPILFAMPHDFHHQTTAYYLDCGYASILSDRMSGSQYHFVHSWGKDTTVWNRIKGLFFSLRECFTQRWNVPFK